jgi:hypothetical protein
MLARWLDRGLGQIVAPDERVAAEPKQEEANASSGEWLPLIRFGKRRSMGLLL